jgi:hypothetical protein
MRRPQKGCTFSTKDLGQCPDFYKISMLAPLPVIDDASTPKAKTDGANPSDRNSTDADAKEGHVDSEIGTTNSRFPSITNAPRSHQGAESTGQSEAEVNEQPSHLLSIGNSNTIRNQFLSPPPQSPADFPSILDVGDCVRSGNSSVASWNDENDDDPWGNTPPFMTMNSLADHRYGVGQVTPPTNRGPPGRLPMQRNMAMMRGDFDMREMNALPHNTMFMNPGADINSYDEEENGLSAADLCYLAQQNKILLDQAQNRPGC